MLFTARVLPGWCYFDCLALCAMYGRCLVCCLCVCWFMLFTWFWILLLIAVLLFDCLFCLILYCAFDTCVLLVVGGFGFALRLAVLLIAY